MNNMTVGMENLPNVFIDKIDLHPISIPESYSGKKYRIRVKLCMYDHSPKRSWYNKPELSDLRIKLALRGGDAAKALNSGELSLHDYDPSETGILLTNANDFSIEEEMGSYTKFFRRVEFELFVPENLNIYAACFIGELDFGNPLFNKFYGPMSAEKIFVGGEVNTMSGYFYYPTTNKEYGGPVHSHQGRQMEGSKHSDRPHSTVRYVMEDNYKIRESIYVEDFLEGTTAGSLVGPNYGGSISLSEQSLYTPSSSPNPGDVPLQEGPDIPAGGGIQLGDFDPTGMGGVNTVLGSEAQLGQAAANRALTRNPLVEDLLSKPKAQDLLANVSFEVRDAIRRGIY